MSTCRDISDIEINPLVVYDEGRGREPWTSGSCFRRKRRNEVKFMKPIVMASMKKSAGKTSLIVGIAGVLGRPFTYIKPFGDRLFYRKKGSGTMTPPW